MRLSALNPGKVLWQRGVNRLRTQIRVIHAFRVAMGYDNLRSRADIMANYAIEAPEVWIFHH